MINRLRLFHPTNNLRNIISSKEITASRWLSSRVFYELINNLTLIKFNKNNFEQNSIIIRVDCDDVPPLIKIIDNCQTCKYKKEKPPWLVGQETIIEYGEIIEGSREFESTFGQASCIFSSAYYKKINWEDMDPKINEEFYRPGKYLLFNFLPEIRFEELLNSKCPLLYRVHWHKQDNYGNMTELKKII